MKYPGMVKRFLVLGTGLWLGAGLGASQFALAESSQSVAAVMSSEEIRNELYGVTMQGVAATTNSRWSECINPEGETIYRLDGMQMHGRLTVTTQVLACFAYEHMDYQSPVCFKVSRTAAGYTFWGGPEGVYKALEVEHDVQSCPGAKEPVG